MLLLPAYYLVTHVLTMNFFVSHSFLVCFIILHFTVLITIWALKMNCRLHSYTRQSWFTYASSNLQQSALSFTLFWTMFYGLVYLY
jgi:hypothetical protein